MSKLRRKLNFFRDCLLAESRSTSLWNIKSSKTELIKPVNTSYINSEPNELLIPIKYAESLAKVLDRYEREKQLMFGRYFIVAYFDTGGFGGGSRRRKVCCPIIYMPCKLVDVVLEDSGGVKPVLEQCVINPAAKEFFEHYNLNANSILDELLNDVKLPFDQQEPLDILQKLQALLMESDELTNQSGMSTNSNEALKKLKAGKAVIVYEQSLYITRKQASAQGALHEIEIIQKRGDMSSALAPILDNTVSLESPITYRSFFNWLPWNRYQSLNLPLPAVLSDAQSKIIERASEQNLSVAVGPPGTGKSFTIASLALKEFTQGNSVLVVSQNQHAVDVVRRKLIDDFGVDPSLTVLGSDEGISREAQQQINRFCASSPNVEHADYVRQIKKLNRMILERQDKEELFLRSTQTHTADQPDVKRDGFFSRFFSAKKNLIEQGDTLLSEQFCDLEERDQDINISTAKLVNLHYQRRAEKILQNPNSRASLKSFAKSLTARDAYYQERYYKSIDFSHVLNAVPFWFAPLSSLYRLLPLQKEMFDIVIIDEATQCNLSVCLPALYRAKRAVVVGDPKQLNHVSFVSYDAQQALFDRYSLNENELSSDFRNKSVLDYAIAALDEPSSVTQLDEHFRSHPQIIEYSNQTFYDNSLKVMTTRPNRVVKAVTIKQVNGRRLRGVNRVEAEAVIDFVKQLVSDQKELPESDVQSIGVLSFFSDQAQLIEKEIFDQLSLNELRRHNIRVGSPFSFQGEERDHMLISCCIDADTSAASYTYFNRDDVFNVSITRARDFQTIFLSCDVDQIKTNSKLKSYLSYCQKETPQTLNQTSHENDAFQDEIYTWLQSQDIKVYRNYVVAGISIDLMAVYEDRALAIDLVGFDGDLKGSLSLKQFKLLARAGLKSFLLPYSEWRNDRERLLERLLLQIGALTQLQVSDKPGVGVFNDEDEHFIAQLTDGISINQLNARFVRSSELRAAKQIPILLEKKRRFEHLLHLCFTPEELTFKRYKNAFNDLLKDCVIKLQQASIASELASSLLEQQKQLFGKPNQSGDDYDDIFAARASMVDEQKNKIKQLISVNESALLQMDKTCIKLNKLYESSDELALSAHDILAELTEKIDLYKGAVHRSSN